MSLVIDAEEELMEERREAQFQEAKELLRHKIKHQNEIKKIEARLKELEHDADPANVRYKEPGDCFQITLGQNAHL